MTEITITKLPAGKLNDAAELLSRAFYKDPLLLYLFPDEQERFKSGSRFFLPNLQHAAADGQMFTTRSFRGIAAWRFMGFVPDSTKSSDYDPRSQLPKTMGKDPFGRLMNVVNCIAPMHKNLMKEKHYYLLFLGIDTDWQGKGIGSQLISPILQRADKEGITCYLETNTEIDVKFYAKHGFQVGDKREIIPGQFDVWGLIRPPRTR
ncbi:MAG: GNAT family N-acetyltransferase [Dehalococcoidia bacterium]|nr:GNAT family N-acetyltransferase [Dehalococcoidia bacterium]